MKIEFADIKDFGDLISQLLRIAAFIGCGYLITNQLDKAIGIGLLFYWIFANLVDVKESNAKIHKLVKELKRELDEDEKYIRSTKDI